MRKPATVFAVVMAFFFFDIDERKFEKLNSKLKKIKKMKREKKHTSTGTRYEKNHSISCAHHMYVEEQIFNYLKNSKIYTEVPSHI